MPDESQRPKYVEKRVRYFDGQYLDVDDFINEQQYHIDRQRRISRLLHVSGILEGLEVEVKDNILSITSGSAVDDQGRQILLSDDGRNDSISIEIVSQNDPLFLKFLPPNLFRIDLSDISKFPRTGNYNLFITCEKITSDPQEGSKEDTRYHERPKLLLQSSSQANQPSSSVFLATLNSFNDGFKLAEDKFPQYSGLQLPAKGGKGVMLTSQNGVKDRAELKGSLSVTGGLNVDGTLAVTGNSTLTGSLTVNNTVSLKGSENGKGLTINSQGNVGIGTTSPSAKLEVSEQLKVSNNSRNINIQPSEIFFSDLGQIKSLDNNHRIIFRRSEDILELREFGKIMFSAGATDGNEAAKMIIQADGKIGIGTTSPGAKLSINGGLHVGGNSDPGDNNLLVDGTLAVTGNSTLTGSLTVNNKITVSGNQKVEFTDLDVTNNLKLQLWTGYGLGINNGTLFYAANGKHSWRDNNGTNERMVLTTGANGSLTVNGTGTSSFAGDLKVSGVLIGTATVPGQSDGTGGAIREMSGPCRIAFDLNGDEVHMYVDYGNGQGYKSRKFSISGSWNG